MNEDSRFEWLGVLKEANQFGMGVKRTPDGSGRPNQPSLSQAVERDCIDAQKLSCLCACVCQLVYADVFFRYFGVNPVHPLLSALIDRLSQTKIRGPTPCICFENQSIPFFDKDLWLRWLVAVPFPQLVPERLGLISPVWRLIQAFL